jgi:hypothetical protein
MLMNARVSQRLRWERWKNRHHLGWDFIMTPVFLLDLLVTLLFVLMKLARARWIRRNRASFGENEMLENHDFCDHCPGCRPALIDLKTGQLMPPDSPVMIAINRIWNTQTTYAERKAFVEVTVHNSRKPEDLRMGQAVMQRFAEASGAA